MNFIGLALKQVKTNEQLPMMNSVQTDTSAQNKNASIFGGGFFESAAEISEENQPREFGGFF